MKRGKETGGKENMLQVYLLLKIFTNLSLKLKGKRKLRSEKSKQKSLLKGEFRKNQSKEFTEFTTFLRKETSLILTLTFGT